MKPIKTYMKIGATALLSTFLYTQCALAIPKDHSTLPGQNLEETVENLQDKSRTNEAPPELTEMARGFSLVQQLSSLINNAYNKKELTVEDIREMWARGANAMANMDQYSGYRTKEEHEEFMISMLSGEYKGIGSKLEIGEDRKIRFFPMPESPAKKAGIKPGDILISIDDYKVTPESKREEVVPKIRGPEGTEVKLKILREGVEEPLEFIVKREAFSSPAVAYSINDDGILYLRVTVFGEDIKEEFDAALGSNDYKGLIIDLRGNPGGGLYEVLDVVDKFIPKDRMMVQVKNKKGFINEKFYAKTEAEIDKPVAILIDKGTGSAAEIFTGVLQDLYPKAKTYGETSMGKGSVQEFIPIFLDQHDDPEKDADDNGIPDDADGFAILTIAEYVLPKGRRIDGIGIKPDVEVTEEDPFYKALEYIKGEIQN